MNHTKEAKSLTFRRGSDVSQGSAVLVGSDPDVEFKVPRLREVRLWLGFRGLGFKG